MQITWFLGIFFSDIIKWRIIVDIHMVVTFVVIGGVQVSLG